RRRERLPSGRALGHGHLLVRGDGSDRQPGEQDPVHVRRSGGLPGDVPLHDRRRRSDRRPALAKPVFDVHAPRRAQGDPSVDAKGLLKSAIRDNNPVISFECSRLASVTGPVPEGDYTIPLGVAEVKRAGRDVTVVGLAYYVREALAVAADLAAEGILLEVIDPRTLVPMDAETIRASVRKTGRLVVIDEAPATCSAASEIIALVTEDPDPFQALKAPAQRVCAAPVPVPFSPPLERAALPDQAKVKAAVRRVLESAPVAV